MSTVSAISNLQSVRSAACLSRLWTDYSAGYEVQRHIEVLARGGKVEMETRAYDVGGARTVPLRSKESAPEYRYMPDPDIPPVQLRPASISWPLSNRRRI